jgi:hypothetical protein
MKAAAAPKKKSPSEFRERDGEGDRDIGDYPYESAGKSDGPISVP